MFLLNGSTARGLLYPVIVYLISLLSNDVKYSPREMIYTPYIADIRIPRMSLVAEYVQENNIEGSSSSRINFGLGTYAKLIRIDYKYFTMQQDIGAAIYTESDEDHNADILGFDGVLDSAITFRLHRFPKLLFRHGYKHLSAHRGDEFILRVPSQDTCINYTRDESIFAIAYQILPSVRSYFEVGYRYHKANYNTTAIDTTGSFRYQFGLEYENPIMSGFFTAIDYQISPEWNYPSFNISTGMALVDSDNKKVYRIALSYYNGHAKLREYSTVREKMFNIGVALDI